MKFATAVLALVLGLAGCSSTSAPAPPSSTAAVAPPTASTMPAAPSSPDASVDGTPTAAPDLASQFREILGTDFNGSALVSRDGDLLFAEGIGMADDANGIPNTPETRFRLGSVTKQFTAMAVLMLASQGLLKTTDPVCDYVDTCPDGWDVVTIEHLLSHSSGIANFTDQPGFDPMKAATPADTVASVADIPLAFEPGASFAYSNTGYVLLGMVIERASGLDYETFLEQHIFEPLGMADSGYEHGDTPGLAVGYASEFEQSDALDMSVPYAAGGLYSTVLDLQRWVDALDADALVDAAAMQRFVTPLADTADGGNIGYAYGVSVGDEDGHRVVSHERRDQRLLHLPGVVSGRRAHDRAAHEPRGRPRPRHDREARRRPGPREPVGHRRPLIRSSCRAWMRGDTRTSRAGAGRTSPDRVADGRNQMEVDGHPVECHARRVPAREAERELMSRGS